MNDLYFWAKTKKGLQEWKLYLQAYIFAKKSMKKGKTPLFCNKKTIIPIFFVSILWFLYGGRGWIRQCAEHICRNSGSDDYLDGSNNWKLFKCVRDYALESEPTNKKNDWKSLFFGGRGWIRTIEVWDDGFTVRCIWPLCNPPKMELVIGIEPTTCWLQVSCSTVEPHQHILMLLAIISVN